MANYEAPRCELCGTPTRSQYGVCRSKPECRTECARRRRTREPSPRMPCEVCGQPMRIPSKYGVCQQTAACRQGYRARRMTIDGDAIRESKRKWYVAHAEVERERARRWAAANPEAVRKKSREYARRKRPQNPEVARENYRKWRAANLEAARESERKYDRQRNQRNDLPCRYSKYGCTDLKIRNSRLCRKHAGIRRDQRRKRRRNDASRRHAQAQGWICTWCGRPLPASLEDTHQDHIIPKVATMAILGYVVDDDWNMDVLHAVCNMVKGDSLTPRAIALAAAHGISLRAA